MKIDIGRSIKYVFLFHLSAILLITIYTFFTEVKLDIAVLTLPYRIITISRTYSDLFISVTAGALFMLLAVSADTGSRRSRSDSFISSALPVIIPSALLYSFFIFYADPRLAERADWFENLSKAGSFYLSESDRLQKEGELVKAVHLADLYLFIDPDNKDVNKTRTEMKINILREDEKGRINALDSEDYEITAAEIFTGEKLTSLAEDFIKKGDYSTAVYYAGMARSFKGSDKKAVELIRQAQIRMRSIDTSATPAMQLFDGKTRLQKLMDEKDFSKAYALYHRLKALFKDDYELKGMGDTLFKNLSENSFFYEEFLSFMFAPGKENIAFINRNEEIEKEIIFAGKIIHADNSIYFLNTYIFVYDEHGEIISSQFSQFAKLIENNLVMQCIGKQTNILILPEMITGNALDLRISVPVRPSSSVITGLGTDENRFRKMKTSFLAENLSVLNSSGYGGISASEEIIIRFVRFFNYIFIQLLVIASGISFMKRNKGSNYAFFLSLPAAVLLIYLAENGIIFLKSGIIRIILTETGLVWSIVIYSVITFTEIAGALVYTVKKADFSAAGN